MIRSTSYSLGWIWTIRILRQHPISVGWDLDDLDRDPTSPVGQVFWSLQAVGLD